MVKTKADLDTDETKIFSTHTYVYVCKALAFASVPIETYNKNN